MVEPTSSQHPDYRLAAAGRESARRTAGSARADLRSGVAPATLFVQPGWRCLGIGAARLDGGVDRRAGGADSHVVATDIDTRYLERLDVPNLEVIQHSILDVPLTCWGSRYDLFVIDAVPSQGRPGAGDQPYDGSACAPVAGCSTRIAIGGWLLRFLLRTRQTTMRGSGKTASGGLGAATTRCLARKVLLLFECCGLQEIRNEGST